LLLIACGLTLIGLVLIQAVGLIGRDPQAQGQHTRPDTRPPAAATTRDGLDGSDRTQPNAAARQTDSHSSGVVLGWEYLDEHVADIDHDLRKMETDLENDWTQQ
jgi:hypothetical protein